MKILFTVLNLLNQLKKNEHSRADPELDGGA